ncbi:MAG: hypothetical protein DBX03_01170, partial [Puniceicoccaceae bacterium]
MKNSQTIDQIKERFIQYGQAHVFDFFSDLSDEEKTELFDQLAAIDLEELQRQVERLIHEDTTEAQLNYDWDALLPAPFIARPENGGDVQQWEEA